VERFFGSFASLVLAVMGPSQFAGHVAPRVKLIPQKVSLSLSFFTFSTSSHKMESHFLLLAKIPQATVLFIALALRNFV